MNRLSIMHNCEGVPPYSICTWFNNGACNCNCKRRINCVPTSPYHFKPSLSGEWL